MSFIDQDEINSIRQSSNIVDIIGSYISLTQKGKNYFCVCPFHNDHSPSMSVSEDKQIYKCFSCGATGNVFTFVENYENVSFAESVSIVAKKSGINLSKDLVSKKETTNDNNYKIMDTALKFYQNNINTKEGQIAKDYLIKRNINENIINEFRIGLSLDNVDSLLKVLEKKNYSKNDLISLGLINKTGVNYYDVFRKRIIFPLEDINGNVVGFSGRIYKSESDSKYVNTKETIIFKKGELLFNYHRAKIEVKQKKQIIIVEGFMDAIRLYSEGIRNVVALMGTSLTINQSNFLKKLRCKIVLCLDNDNAGEIATFSVGEELIKNDIEVDVIRLSDAKDPDEYIIKFGIELFKNNLNNLISYNDFRMNYLKKDINMNNSLEVTKYINEVLKHLKDSDDDILKELTINKLSKEFDISLELLKDKINNTKKEKDILIKEKVILIENKKTKYDTACEKVLFYMMNDVKYIKAFSNKVGYFNKKIYRDVANEIIYFYETNKFINLADFISYINKNEHALGTVMSIIGKNNTDEIDNLEFNLYIKLVKEDNEKYEITILKNKLNKETDINKKIIIAEKIAQLKKGSVE